ncbi:hypothetical protein HN873_059189, partial [Arachis hypogaea]
MDNWNEDDEKECNDKAKLFFIIKDNLMEAKEMCTLIGEYAVKYICKNSHRTNEQT